MYEETNSRKVFLSVLGVAILLVAVVGISFAAFSDTFTGDSNSISTGTITMSYTEPVKGIELTDALPVSDATAMGWNESGKVFPFTVVAGASGTIVVPYEIVVEKVEGTLADEAVKVALTKGETGSEGAPIYSGTMKNFLDNAAEPSFNEARNGKVIHTETVSFVEGQDAPTNATQKYNLRIWINEAATVSEEQDYKVLVHVDSAVSPIGR